MAAPRPTRASRAAKLGFSGDHSETMSISRRYFFFGTLLAGAVPRAGFGSVPSLKALGYKPFYEKLNVASVGCGGQGGVDLNEAAKTENIVALCDVDEARASFHYAKYPAQPKYK